MQDKAEITILWDNEKGLEGNVIINCDKNLKGKVVRILIAQLSLLQSCLIDDLKKDNKSMNIEFKMESEVN